jgi:hypothetical protein
MQQALPAIEFPPPGWQLRHFLHRGAADVGCRFAVAEGFELSAVFVEVEMEGADAPGAEGLSGPRAAASNAES